MLPERSQVSLEKILTAFGQEWVWMLLQLHQIFHCFSLSPAAADTQTRLPVISFGVSPLMVIYHTTGSPSSGLLLWHYLDTHGQ